MASGCLWLAGGLEQLPGGLAVLGHALALGQHDAVGEHALGIAELGGTGVPLGGEREVLRRAVAFRIDAPHQRVRLRIALLGSLEGEVEGGEVFALVVGLVGGILDHGPRLAVLAGTFGRSAPTGVPPTERSPEPAAAASRT